MTVAKASFQSAKRSGCGGCVREEKFAPQPDLCELLFRGGDGGLWGEKQDPGRWFSDDGAQDPIHFVVLCRDFPCNNLVQL